MENSIKVNVETTVSTTVRLDDLTLEKYFKIIDFIESVTGKKTPIFPKTAGNTEVKASEEKEDSGTDKYAGVGRYKGYEKIVDVFKDAEANPGRYEWEYHLASVWKSMVPELSGVPGHSVSHVLGMMVKRGITEKDVRKNPNNCLNENFYRVPVPAAQEASSARKPEDVKLGAILRKARMDAGLSVKELSAGIGYDVPIIVNWESGIYHMADTALRAIHNFFKKDIFAEAKEASA